VIDSHSCKTANIILTQDSWKCRWLSYFLSRVLWQNYCSFRVWLSPLQWI